MPRTVMPKIKRELMHILPEQCETAINAIFGAFAWYASKEGQDYWYEVTEKLRAYKEQEEENQ